MLSSLQAKYLWCCFPILQISATRCFFRKSLNFEEISLHREGCYLEDAAIEGVSYEQYHLHLEENITAWCVAVPPQN